MPFYAHPKDEEQADLTQHLLRTADLAKILVNGLGLEETAHYTGLLHDLGKLNPYYQNLFAAPADERRNLERKLQQEYVRMHSVFSALAAYQLLKSPHREKVTSAVAAHHSKLLPIHKIFEPLKTDSKQIKQVKKSLEGFLSNLSLFAQNHNFPIDLFKLDKSIPQPNFFEATAQNYINEYIEFNTLYAALIIADRSSFFNWEKPKYTLTCHTSVLVRQGTFTQLRSEFQNTVLLENSFIDCIMVLKAPTGIGKTKMFLDIANVISRRENLERVFYFSPLLALTEDFEGKLKQVLDENALSRVLVYNHAFTGSLAEREDESSDSYEDFFKSKEYFMRESFSYEFIITTTQRLLMTLYSNAALDKMKLLAFRNSLLIIDEVQTIPKFLLPNLIQLLAYIAEKYNARILFVSATIPDALHKLPTLKYPQKTEDEYLNATLKRITYSQQFDVTDATVQSGRVLIMVNTRRKAREIYEQISKFREDVIYLSAGITKKQRREIVQAINSDEPVLAVSTQVLEAGVDISFDKIFREMAPLDNIVQTMGRLNREGKSLVTPTLTVFEIDEDAAPYDPLEMKLSKQILPRISDSKALYMVLPDYYRELAKAHATNKIRLSELETKMRKLCFDDVWDFVKRKALPADVGDTVFIPRENEWEKVKDTFLFGKFAYQRVAEYAAELPKSFIELNRKHGLQSMFDADLMQREILLPKKEHLADIYDVKVGLDKWTM